MRYNTAPMHRAEKNGGKAGWAALLLAACALAAGAGAPEPFASNVPEDPFAWFLYTYDEAASLESDRERSGEVVGHETEAACALPVWEGRSGLLMAGVSVKHNRFEFRNVDVNDQDLYAVTVPVDGIYTGAQRWVFWGGASPGLFSDLDDPDSGHYRILLRAMVAFERSPSLELALGAFYDHVFGEDEVYPVGGVVWSPSAEWTLSLLLPMPRVTYAPTRRFLVFAEALPAGDTWSLTDEGQEYDFKLESYRLGLGAEYGLAEHVWLQAAAGVDVAREYELDGPPGEDYKSEAEDTFFLRVGLLAR